MKLEHLLFNSGHILIVSIVSIVCPKVVCTSPKLHTTKLHTTKLHTIPSYILLSYILYQVVNLGQRCNVILHNTLCENIIWIGQQQEHTSYISWRSTLEFTKNKKKIYTRVPLKRPLREANTCTNDDFFVVFIFLRISQQSLTMVLSQDLVRWNTHTFVDLCVCVQTIYFYYLSRTVGRHAKTHEVSDRSTL